MDCRTVGVRAKERRTNEVAMSRNGDKWTRCDDKLPELGRYVLVTDGNMCKVAFLAVVWPDGTCYWMYDKWYSCYMKLTHWMPLPELPERRKEEV